MEPARTDVVPRGALIGWAILVGAYIALAYAANAAGDPDPDREVLYEWSTAAAAIVQYAVMAAIVLALARRLTPATLGFRRPRSWAAAAGLVVVSYLAILAIAGALGTVLDAGEEQGLVPDEWDPDRAAPFVANFAVVVLVAPFVEELVFRGLGYAAVRDAFGSLAAIVATAVTFGLAHGLLVAFPALAAFGLILGWLRRRTDSLYPCIVLHALFNGVVLIVAVTTGVGT